jgi:hypothetical protein
MGRVWALTQSAADSQKPAKLPQLRVVLPWKRRGSVIWTLRIKCVRGRFLREEFVRIIEIDSGTDLLDLHDVIQDAVGFDRDHMFEFFAGRHERNPKVLFDDSDGSDGSCPDMTLEQVFPLENKCKLYYHFDFGDDWYFEIAKTRTKPKEPEPRVKYPRVIERIGPKPQQYGG